MSEKCGFISDGGVLPSPLARSRERGTPVLRRTCIDRRNNVPLATSYKVAWMIGSERLQRKLEMLQHRRFFGRIVLKVN